MSGYAIPFDVALHAQSRFVQTAAQQDTNCCLFRAYCRDYDQGIDRSWE